MSYKVKIRGGYRGTFKTLAEAMAYIDKNARPWKHSWVILDQWQKVYAQG